MDISFNKIKSALDSKERRRDIAYMGATIVVIGLTIGLFIWSVNIILKAVDASFVVSGEEDVSSEILSFNLDEFVKVASRLGISFSLEKMAQESIIPAPAPIIETPIIETQTTSTTTTSTQEITSTSTAQ